MADWTTLPNTAVGVGGLPSGATVTALRDNPIAIAEGAAGAPVVPQGWTAYDKVTNGDSATGVIWSFPVNGAVSSIVSPDFVDGFEYLFFIGRVRGSTSTNRNLRYEVFRETSAAYASPTNMGNYNSTTNSLVVTNISSTLPASGYLRIEFPRQVLNIHPTYNILQNGISDVTGTALEAGGIINHATAQKILRVRFSLNADNITGSGTTGQIIMLKRRVNT